ncbi:GNAT family N-acetyltransferase [Thalassiella azotivora]
MTPQDVGRRVAVRHRLPDGRATDVVGELVAVSERGVDVLPDDGPPVRVPAADVVAVRVVPPRTVTDASSPAALERVAALGWPGLESERLGGWLLRAAGGFTRRANSALAVGDPGSELDDALTTVRGWYAARGLAASVQVPVPLTGDRRFPDDGTLGALQERGWVPDDGTVVMTRRLRDLPDPDRDADPAVRLTERPDRAWLDLYRYRGQALPPVAVDVLTAAPHQRFASVVVDGVTVAVGRVAVARGWAGVAAMQVAGSHRRRGLARTVLTALLAHGRDAGARFAYLQVEAANAPARALYEATGFTGHHAYHYLAPPRDGR